MSNVTTSQTIRARKIKLFDIPKILFAGFSEARGIGDVKKTSNGPKNEVFVQEISVDGIVMAIELINFDEGTNFRIHKELSKKDNLGKQGEILVIWALQSYNGTHTKRAHLISEKITFELKGSLEEPEVDFALFVLEKAREIIRSDRYITGTKFWRKNR